MTHASHDALWALARGEAADAPVLEAHLQDCPACQALYEDVRSAQQLLLAMPEVPPMPPALARRVGDALAEEAERRLASRWTSWSSFDLPRFALVSAAVAAVVALAWLATRETVSPKPSTPLVTQEPPAPKDSLSPAPPRPVAPALEPKKLTATVATAKKAKLNGAAIAKAQVLESGATVATEPKGSLWLRLPDGSRAGVAASSQVQLARLEEHAVSLEVQQGSLALLIPHREDRLLTVRAGEVVVKDLGTSFMVSREVNRVLVAVEEGSVELSVPGETRTLGAGQAAEWHDGKLELARYEPARRPAAAVAKATPDLPDAVEDSGAHSIARLTEEDDDAPPPPSVEPSPAAEQPSSAPPLPPGEVDENWAPPPSGTAAVEPRADQPPPPPSSVETATPPGADDPFNLRSVERRVNDLRRQLHSPFPPSGVAFREAGARNIGRLADAGDCHGALLMADRWLREPPVPGEELRLRRAVLLQQKRCFTRLGRILEAEQVQRELDRR